MTSLFPSLSSSSSSRAQTNKQLMQAIFAELATGNGRPFVDAMAENFCWVVSGQTVWSRRYEGKQVVREQLFKPLFAQFAGTYTNRATRFVAEDDLVVVECRGEVTTHKGKPYNNTYCYVCRFMDGLLVELVEYLDTQLVNEALNAPVLDA